MHTHTHSCLVLSLYRSASFSLTGACETGVAGVHSSGVSGAGTGAEVGAGAETGTKLDRRVKGDADRHSVRFMAGR